MKEGPHKAPEEGLRGLIQNWRNDLIAAISVSLVALPLSLGIAVASEVPPMSGIIAAVIGGIVTTFFRGSHVAINGPAAGLITVILGAAIGLNDGSGRALNYVLAAIVVSGIIQVILGILKSGRLAEIFPSYVIHGIMAAIGIIIFAKQIHVALGTESDADTMIGTLIDAVTEIGTINPFVAVIALTGVLLLAFHAKISYKLFHFLPAHIWVLLIGVVFVYLFDFFAPHTIEFMGKAFEVGPSLLIDIPDNPLDALLFPDFSRIDSGAFWLAVLSITLIGSVQTMAMAKAVDKLDPYRRKTNLNKDLMALGMSNIVSGSLGGLPIITVIARSSVNVQNNAKTRWSNFYNGVFLACFVLLLAPLIQKVPLAALAAILVFTGYKLAAPRVFAQAYEQGIEQVLFLIGTLVITLYSNLLWGILGGILLTLAVHILLARVPIPVFFRMIFNSGTHLEEKQNGQVELKVKGIANFLSMIKINKLLETVPAGSQLKVNLSTARLVDLTVLESLEEFRRVHRHTGGEVIITGTEEHVASTNHRLALKSLTKPLPHRLTAREQKLKQIAVDNDWIYRHEVEWDDSYLRNFQFFETRPIERKVNVISGHYPKQGIRWEISDVTFDEGALLAAEVYHTTTQLLQLPFTIPRFAIEQEGLFDKIFDRVMAFSGQKDIDFELFTKFSDKFLLKGDDEAAIRSFFTPKLIQFLEQESIYHIESNGEALLIFKYLRLARTEETTKMVEFSERLIEQIQPQGL